MSKRTAQALRKDVLEALKDGKPHSLGDLERKTGSNWLSVRNHVDDLILFGAVTKKEFARHDQNGRSYIEVTITKEGLALLKKL
ncbi:MAG: hypothetical protein Q7S55_04600 [Nanoarchaeota archaeon]|nr:hypothetical protein [Nanoarchaeota archaeon]